MNRALRSTSVLPAKPSFCRLPQIASVRTLRSMNHATQCQYYATPACELDELARKQYHRQEQHPMKNPIQAKISIAEAFANAVEQKQASEENGGSSAADVILSAGIDGSLKVPIWWLAGSKTIVVAFLASSELQALGKNSSLELVKPFYITDRGWHTHARVSEPVAFEFEAVHKDVKHAMDNLSGHQIRHVLLTGRQAGGALACVAAPWAKLHWPSADVRCISFNAPGVGNKEFVELFGWLAYGYNAVHKGQEPSGKLHVPVISVRYKGEPLSELSTHLETGNGMADGGHLEAPMVELAATMQDPEGIVHFLDAESMERVVLQLGRTRGGMARDRYTGVEGADEEEYMRRVSKKELHLFWTNLRWGMHMREG